MLSKFTSLEDAYLFLWEFEEVCSMMHFPNIPIDAVHMKLIPFALKDYTNVGCMAWLLILLLLRMILYDYS